MSYYKGLQENIKNWNLECDTQSFGMIETFAQNFLNKIDFFKSELTKTDYTLKDSQNDVAHLFCKFQNLSNNHFVENSVKEIDFTRKEEKKPELQKNDSVRTQEIVIELFKSSLQNGMNAVNLAQIMSNPQKEDELNRSDTIRNEAISISNFNYMGDKANRLPYIYGTKQFFSTEYIGLVEKSEVEAIDEKDFGTISTENKDKSPEKSSQKSPQKSKTKVEDKKEKVEKPEKMDQSLPPPINQSIVQKPSTTDSVVAFLKDADPNRKNTGATNIVAPPTNILPPPPPPPPLNLLLTQPVKKPEPPKLPPIEPKKEENLPPPIQPTLQSTQENPVEKAPQNIKSESKPMDMMEEIRQKQQEMKKKKEAAALGITQPPTEQSPRKISAPVKVAEEISKNVPPKKSGEEILENSDDLAISIARSSSDFKSASHKKDFSTINKERLKIKQTQNLFPDEEENQEEPEEDPLFKNSTKRPLNQIFKPVEVSPVRHINDSSTINERPPQEEESPKRITSRPSLRKQDFDQMEEKLINLPKIDASTKNNEKLKGLFIDSDEEKPEDIQRIYKLGDNDKNTGIVLKNLRKSHTIKQNEEEQQKSNNNPIDHDLMMDKPPVIRKKKKAPTIFQDEEEEVKEEKKVTIEKKIEYMPPKTKIEEREERENESETLMFQKERFEEEKSIVPLRMSTNHNSRKLEKLFDDEEDEDSMIFNKPKILESTTQKKRLVFDDDDDEEN